MSDKGKVIKAGIGYTIGNYLLKGLTFLTLPIFTRLMSKSDFGIYNTYFAYEAIVAILIGLALHSSLKNGKYKFKEDFKEYISSIILLVLLNFVLWIVICNLFFPIMYSIFDLSRLYFNLLLLYSLCSAMIMLYNTYVGLDYKFQSFLLVSALNMIGNIALSLLLILTLFDEQRGYGRIIGASIPVVLIGFGIIIYFFRQKQPKVNKEYWKFGLTYSLPIIPHGISQMILLQFDRIMIKKMIGDSEAGLYGFSYSIYSIISITGSSLDSVFGPWFYEKMNKAQFESIKEKGGMIAKGMMLISLLMILIAPELILFLGGNEFKEGIYTAIPLIIGGYFSFLYLLPAYVEYYHEKTKFIAMGTMIAAGLNIVLNYFCIKQLGYVAAAYTTLVTYIFYFLFHYFLAYKVEGKMIYSSRQLFTYSIVALVGLFVALFLIDKMVIRLILFVLLFVYTYIWADKKIGIKNVIKKKLLKK